MAALRSGYNTPGVSTPGTPKSPWGDFSLPGAGGGAALRSTTTTGQRAALSGSLADQQAASPKNSQPSVGVSPFFGVATTMSSTAVADTTLTSTVARLVVLASG